MYKLASNRENIKKYYYLVKGFMKTKLNKTIQIKLKLEEN